MSARDEAWVELDRAATDFGILRSAACASRLGLAAQSWALANGYVRPVSEAKPVRVVGTRGNTLRSGQVVPFGRSKGQPVEECDDRDLMWLQNAMRESVADPAKERWREKNQTLLDAIDAELESRGTV